jgi:uncharacterized protein (TIGR04222 family)
MDTWGISGPTFIAIYGSVLVVTGTVVFAIRHRLSGSAGRAGLAGLRTPELGPYEVAMLKGGDSLVPTVAACRLKESGCVTAFRRGRRGGHRSGRGAAPPRVAPGARDSDHPARLAVVAGQRGAARARAPRASRPRSLWSHRS